MIHQPTALPFGHTLKNAVPTLIVMLWLRVAPFEFMCYTHVNMYGSSRVRRVVNGGRSAARQRLLSESLRGARCNWHKHADSTVVQWHSGTEVQRCRAGGG